MRNLAHRMQQKGSVVIVALCFAAVLGIVLASYLAVSNQAMKLSNRSYLKSVSKNLAEMGLEQALWAFNRNSWDPSLWMLSTNPNVNTATLKPSISVSGSLYGNGVTGTVSTRVENYDAPSRGKEWKSTVSYAKNDVVSYGRISTWNAGAGYSPGDIVIDPVSTTDRYRCIKNAKTGQTLNDVVYWQPITAGDFTDFRRWYLCTSLNTNKPPPDSNFWDDYTPVVYAEGAATPPTSAGQPIKTQIRSPVSIGPLFPNAVGVTSSLIFDAASVVDSYDSTTDPTASIHGFSATLASTGTSNPTITINSATIQGYIATPSSPLYQSLASFSGGASLKNKTGPVISPHPTAPNVDLTRISRSPYVPQFAPSIWYDSTGFSVGDVTRFPGTTGSLYRSIQSPNINHAPSEAAYWQNTPIDFATLTSAPIGTAGGPPVTYVLSGNLDLNDGDTITIRGPVILDIQGRLRIRGSGNIHILATGSAEIYFTGSLSVGTFSGPTPAAASGFTYDSPPDPKKLILVGNAPFFGTNRYWSTSPFYGVIYVKDAPVLNVYTEVYGALSGKSIRFLNPTNLHYDTSLRTTTYHSIDVLYVLTDWRELTDPADQVTFP